MNARYFYLSPVGVIALETDGRALTAAFFCDEMPSCTSAELPVFEQAVRWFDAYFSGREPGFTPELELRGTPFQRSVWELLLRIPYGQTVSYGELAAELAHQHGIAKMSAQAVGGAVGHNPVAVIVPCHRVIGADGSLTGYAGGLDVKRRLLEHEGAVFGSSGRIRKA